MDKSRETECSLLDCQHQMIDNPTILFAIVLVFFFFLLYKFFSFFLLIFISSAFFFFLSSFWLINILFGCFALIDRSTMVHENDDDDFIGLVLFYPHPILIFEAKKDERTSKREKKRESTGRICSHTITFSHRDESSVTAYFPLTQYKEFNRPKRGRCLFKNTHTHTQ